MATPHKSEFKPSPLGPIPVDWKVKDLGEVCKVTSGGTPDRKTKEYWGGNIPWVTTSLIDFNIITEAQEFITQEGLKNSAAKLFDPGTIIMALYGQGVTRGKVALLNINATTNQACAAIIIKDKQIDTLFLFQYLVSQYRDIRNLSNTGNQENLNGELVKSIKMPVPTCSEQQAIAHALATWDKAIEMTTQLITAKEQRKKWLMQQLLTGKKRLEGFTGNWEQIAIGDLLSKMSNGMTYNTDNTFGIPVTRIETISTGEVNFQKVGFANANDNIENFKLEYGDILYSHINSLEHIGKTAIYLSSEELYHGMNLLLLRANKHVDHIFLFYWLRSTHARKIARRLANQAVNQASINTTELRKVILNIPSLAEQKAVANILRTADKEIDLLKQQLEAFKEQKKGLMQVLLTGKKRLKV